MKEIEEIEGESLNLSNLFNLPTSFNFSPE